ncbi:MAG: protein kinase, partial [Gemmatimonadota bacterium]
RMKREDWDRIGSLFDEALKRSGAERDEFLSSLGDGDLEQELRSLLSAHEGRGAFDELADYVSGPEAQRLLRLGPGDQIGPYRIVRELGSGGMATVYRAEDLKHERQVAIKVLRPELAAVLGADRFLQEITTTARLQHPHILPLLDSGQAEGLLYYVMPYIEGETLRDKLNRERQLSIEEAVRITTEVADALDYAHRRSVIHRDIKPENILLHEVRPLVADFGIALAVSEAAGGRITETGLSLGTPQYMSPEQATAEKDLTHRSDIYSLGCVLYEMLTGDPPHTGTSAQQIMRKVVTDEATPITDLRKSVPPNVAAATAKSLEKLPADRFESARTFAEALADPTFTTPTTWVVSGVAETRERWNRLTVGLVAVAVVATLTSVWAWLRPVARDVDRPVVEFYLDPPDATMSFSFSLALSPDGRRLVCVVETDEGSVLYQRMLDERDWRIIPGTEGAYWPFFSPDGEWLGFVSSQEGAIKRVPVGGGSAHTIARFDGGVEGASWGPKNTVVFSAAEMASGKQRLPVFRVTVDGGVPERLTTRDTALGEMGCRDPHYLPGGEVVLFTGVNPLFQTVVAALSLESGTMSRLTPGMTPQSDGAGRVVYVTSDGTAVAQTFNPQTLALEGSPRPIAEGIAIAGGIIASYTVSSDGSLAYLSESAQGGQLLLVSREGETRPLFSSGVGSSVGSPRFSPTGDRIAFGLDRDVWVYSLAEGTARRLSFEGPSTDPAWTSDGRSIGYSVGGEGDGSFASLYLRAADGTGSAEQILASDRDLWQMDFAPGDSEVVMYSMFNVFRASLGSDSGPVALMETEAFVEHPTLSPDGRWLAYKSNESGINEVYVRSYPDMGPPTVVSIGGGNAPAWSADGREIFYWGRGRIMAASVRYDGSRLTVVERTELFRAGSFRWGWNRNYDVHPNGQEFVMVGRPEGRVVWRVNALAGRR